MEVPQLMDAEAVEGESSEEESDDEVINITPLMCDVV